MLGISESEYVAAVHEPFGRPNWVMRLHTAEGAADGGAGAGRGEERAALSRKPL